MRDSVSITNDLIASGLTPAQTALLMELVLSMSTGLSTGQGGENRALEKRRAWDRDRQQRRRAAEREAKGASAPSTGHPPESTGQSGGQGEVCLTVEVKKEGLSVKEVSKKGSRLLVGARVSDENRKIAIECGCPPDRVDDVWTEFVDYWSDIPGQKGCKLSWTGTWRNRVKQIFGGSLGKRAYGNRADTPAGRASSREANILAAVGRGAMRVLENGHAARSVGPVSANPGPAERNDPERDAAWADYQSRVGHR